MITEQLIDETVERFTDAAMQEAVIAELEAEQPWLLAYLFSENMEVFTQQEREFYALSDQCGVGGRKDRPGAVAHPQ
jgi:ribosomal silencing factor RsfS